MTRITDIRGHLQPESSGWLLSHHLQGAGHIWRPHYRPRSLIVSAGESVLLRPVCNMMASRTVINVGSKSMVTYNGYFDGYLQSWLCGGMNPYFVLHLMRNKYIIFGNNKRFVTIKATSALFRAIKEALYCMVTIGLSPLYRHLDEHCLNNLQNHSAAALTDQSMYC